MITDNENPNSLKRERPIFKMAEMCIGPMSSPAGNNSRSDTAGSNQSTAHVHIKTIAPWEKRS